MKQSVRKAVENELTERMPKDRPGDFNQAMMELGAVVCVPNGTAKCEECPLGAVLPCQKTRNCRRTSGKSTEKSPHHRTAHQSL